MKKEKIYGIWILENRIENPKQENPKQGNSFTIFEQEYEFVGSEMEILFFNKKGECYQIGVKERTLEDRNEFDYDVLYEDTSIFPGAYDIENKTINIIEKGNLEILIDGKLRIVEKEKDYACEEVWSRLSKDNKVLQSYVESLIKELNLV